MVHPRFLTDSFRLLRSSIVGFVTTLALIQVVTFKEAVTVSVTIALAWDLFTLYRRTWTLSLQETRQVFERWTSVESYVALRSVTLVFMSVGLLCFCINDLHDPKNVLPGHIQIFLTFIALFLAWLQLHNGFAIYYAKCYFEQNPRTLEAGEAQQAFVFQGSEPGFSDFLYVAYSIGLTYSMTDCSVEDSAIRRVVIIHCIAAFLFASTVLSIILSLVTQVS